MDAIFTYGTKNDRTLTQQKMSWPEERKSLKNYPWRLIASYSWL